MAQRIDDQELLLEEYKYFTGSFWKNEEIGEKRVEFFITLTTAVIAAVVTLITSDRATSYGIDIRQIGLAALAGILLIGLITFLRMLKRNRVTDEYKDKIDYIREQLRIRSINLPEYKIPFRSDNRLIKGGLAETIGMMNSIILAVIVAIWLGYGFGWLIASGVFILSFASFVLAVKFDRDSEKEKKDRNDAFSREETFRAGVGAIILGRGNLVLALERKDLPGSWQLPQGGIKKGEDPLKAVKREITEETGILKNKLNLASEESQLLAYELPKEYRNKKTGMGQTQRWFIFRFLGSDKDITLGDKQEFAKHKWIKMEDLMWAVVPFRKSVYQELERFLKQYLQSEANLDKAHK